MIVERDCTYALMKQYENLFGKETLEITLEKKLREKDFAFTRDREKTIKPKYLKVFGPEKFRDLLQESIFEKISREFTMHTREVLKNSFGRYKQLFVSEPDNMAIFSGNDIFDYRNKRKLIDRIVMESQIDTTVRPLLFLLTSLRKFTRYGSIVEYKENRNIFIYQNKELFSPCENSMRTIYRDKDEFLLDIQNLVRGLDFTQTKGYFNISLLTYKDGKKPTPPVMDEFSIAI